MLQLSAAQLDSLTAPIRARLPAEFADRLHADHRVRVAPLGRDETIRRVAARLDRGVAHGLRTQRDLYLFVQLAIVLGWDHDADPAFAWIDDLMAAGRLGTPSERLTLAVEMLRG